MRDRREDAVQRADAERSVREGDLDVLLIGAGRLPDLEDVAERHAGERGLLDLVVDPIRERVKRSPRDR
jgi:hypothetical protein